MITIRKVNNEVVRPIPLEQVPPDKIKGYELFDKVFANIFLLAKKRSGKTSTIFKILKSCVGKQSTLFIFASTIHIDDNWKHILQWLDSKGIEYLTFTSIKEGKTNHLDDILKTLQVESNDEEPQEETEEDLLMRKMKGESKSDKPRKPRKPKKMAAEYFFIFDDLGVSLRSPSINNLLKTHRHYKSKVIISSQYLNDLLPEARLQLDYVLVFGGNSEDKLKALHKDIDLSIPFETFMVLYTDATSEKYNFLYLDARNETFRKNFNMVYELPSM